MARTLRRENLRLKILDSRSFRIMEHRSAEENQRVSRGFLALGKKDVVALVKARNDEENPNSDEKNTKLGPKECMGPQKVSSLEREGQLSALVHSSWSLFVRYTVFDKSTWVVFNRKKPRVLLHLFAPALESQEPRILLAVLSQTGRSSKTKTQDSLNQFRVSPSGNTGLLGGEEAENVGVEAKSILMWAR